MPDKIWKEIAPAVRPITLEVILDHNIRKLEGELHSLRAREKRLEMYLSKEPNDKYLSPVLKEIKSSVGLMALQLEGMQEELDSIRSDKIRTFG